MRLDQAPLRIALVYLAAGLSWIALTDWLLAMLRPDLVPMGQAGKGVVFVGLSASLIYILVSRELGKRAQLKQEREDLHRRLAASQRLEAIGRLTAGIAHDFNNLLTAISGNLQSYIGASGRPQEDLVELTEAASAASRAEELTRQLLAFGRQQEIRGEPLDLNEVIDDLGQLLRRLIGDRIEIRADLAPSVWVINMDRGPLQQLVMNLALNARDAMPHGGSLALETSNIAITDEYARRHFDFPVVAGDYVRLAVRDTGIGMDEETQARIYEPFFTTKAKHVGTGLGMSTVYGVVKQAGGYIDVESAPGRGTRFDLYFPRGAGKPAPDVPEATREDDGHGHRTGTVLVVEDEVAVRSFVVRTLRRRGFTTIECSSGPEALSLLQSPATEPVDLLLTDAIMPGMTGIELIEHVRRIPLDVPVLLMSGYARDEVPTDAPYLSKPFTTTQLIGGIRQALESNGRHREAS